VEGTLSSDPALAGTRPGMVTFRWRDPAHQNQKPLTTLPVNEFLRRFLLHVLPPGFVRIRHFGLTSHRRRGASLRSAYNCVPLSAIDADECARASVCRIGFVQVSLCLPIRITRFSEVEPEFPDTI